MFGIENEDAYWNAVENRWQAEYDDDCERSEHASYLEEIKNAAESLIDTIKDYEKSDWKGECFTAIDISELENVVWECEQAIDEILDGRD